MADLPQTPVDVGVQGNCGIDFVIAGENLDQGQPVYQKASDFRYWRADSLTLEKATCSGIAMTPAAAGEPFIVAKTGLLDLGVPLVPGMPYVVSNTPGRIAPVIDIATGWTGRFVTVLGEAVAINKFNLRIHNAVVALGLITVGAWILAGGSWNDAGVWDDSSFWID